MDKRVTKKTFILAVVFFGALVIRLALISKGPYHNDALELAVNAQATLATGQIHYLHTPGHPLSVLAGAFFIFLLGGLGLADPVLCVNVMSAVCGAAGVLLFFLLVEELFDSRRALYAALLLAIFPLHVAVSTFGRNLTLSICLVLASALYLARYSRRGRRTDLVAAGLFLGLCGATRLPDVAAIVPLSFYIASDPRTPRDRLRDLFFFGSTAGAVLLFFYIPLAWERGIGSFISILTEKNAAAFLGVCSVNLGYSLRWVGYTLHALGIALTLAGLLLMVLHRQKRAFLFLVLWYVTFQLFFGNLSCDSSQYMAIALLPLVMAQGYYLGSTKRIFFSFIVFLLVIVVLFGYRNEGLALTFRHERALQAEFGRWVAGRTSPHDAIIALDEGPFIKYYGHRDTVRPDGISWDNLCKRDFYDRFFTERVDPLFDSGRRVFLITSLFAYDECGVFVNMIDRRYKVFFRGERYNELWHRSPLRLQIFLEALFELEKKP